MPKITLPPVQLPRAIWYLGFVSMLMDISSEMIHSLLPMFMVSVLGASAIYVGFIEGLAEATALMVKVFSGTLSDFLGKRKGLAILGYGLGAISKPLFALASSLHLVLGARLLDRVGKGMRGAPRDALVADLAPREIRGAAYGLRQSLDTLGSLLGPLLAVLLMVLWASDFRAVFWVAVIPAVCSVLILVLGVKEPQRVMLRERVNPFERSNLNKLGRQFWRIVLIGSCFTLARFSEAFLILRALDSGISMAQAPLVLAIMNLVYAAAAYPFGRLSDSHSKHKLLALSLLVLIAADICLAINHHWWLVIVGVGLWGLHMGISQGLLATMVANAIPQELRGTAFGIFNLACGLALLCASLTAGVVWELLGPAFTFYAGAIFCLLTLLLLGRQPAQASGEASGDAPS